jgi:hypothetical protein
MGFLSAFDKFGKNLKRGFTDFAVKAGKDFSSAGRFIEQKALPVLQKVAGGIATGAKFLAPALAFTPLAEFAPLVAGIGLGAGAAARAIGTGRKVLKVAGEAVDAVKRPSLEKTAAVGRNVARASRLFG